MFSKRLAAEQLTMLSEHSAKSDSGLWIPEYHSLSQIEGFNSHFRTLAAKAEFDGNDVESALGDQELAWISNEYQICACDTRYWLENYAFINDDGVLVRFDPRHSQSMLLDMWAEREESGSAIEQQVLKARQQGACLDPETPVLTADLRWIPIKDIETGQQIVAVDENHPGGRGADRKMRTAVVEAKREIVGVAVKITMDNGDVLIATPDHRFLSKKWECSSDTRWKFVRDMGIGTSIRYITESWGSSPSYEDGWFGGMMDGEGHMASPRETGASVQVHQRYGPIWERMRRYLDGAGYTYSVFEDKRSATPNGKLGKDPVACVEVSRMDQLFRLIGTTRPTRYDRRWWEGKSLPGKRSGVGWRKIKAMEVLPSRRMIDLQTSCKTFIANGYVSHNSTVCELAIAHKVNFGIGVKAAVASYDQDACERMGGMMELAFNEMPSWMKANPTSDRAGSLKAFAATNTRLTLYSGKKAAGIARGDTPSVLHICLAPDTPLHLADGKILPICEVQPGDKVITSRGRIVPVKACIQSPRPAEVASELWLWGNYSPLVVTRDHPILTPDGFVYSENLGKGDFVSIPVRKISRKIRYVNIEYPAVGRKPAGRDKSTIRKASLNRTWGWLCGLYVAEGSLTTSDSSDGASGVCFSIHRKEEARVITGLREALGMFQHIGVSHSKKALTSHINVHCSGLGRWLGKTFGSGAENKTIPDWVFQAGNDFVEGLVKGYFEGDGHISPRVSEVICHSISMSLIIQMRDLLASMGIGWSSIYRREGGFLYGRNCRPIWSLQVASDSARLLRRRMGWEQANHRPARQSAANRAKKWRYSEDGTLIHIQVFENLPRYCETFYDLEVDAPEHDFTTIHCCVKNSEVSIFPDASNVIEKSLFQAVHPSPNTFMILESTGNGNTDWWARTWYSSRDYWASGGARLQPVFFPWFIAIDIFPTPVWRKDHPVPQGWQPLPETQRMMAKAAQYVHQTPLIRKYAGDDWRMQDFQAYYWEQMLLEARRKGEENSWYQEMPMDDIEALRPKKDLVFDIIEVQKQEENREPYTCWAIIGEQVQERYHPMEEEIDREQEPFRVSYDGNITDLRGRIAETFWWEFVPLKQPNEAGIDLFDAERKCMIFRWPEEGYTYGIGVDNSGGTGRDGSYISVNGKSIYGNEPDFQAACFWTNRVDPSLMHPYIMALVSLYKTEMPEGNEPVVGIEQVFGLGDTPQIQMLSMGFNKRNLYHFSRLDGKNPEADKKKSHRMGWYTTEWSRNFMLSTYKTAVENHWRRVNDPFLLKQEIPSFQIDKTDGGKTRWDHQDGKRDDRIFGDGISFIILNDTESFARRIQTKFEGEDEELVIDYGYPVGINSTMEQMMGADL